RLGGALADAGRGCMSGVAEQYDTTGTPTRKRVEVVDIVQQDPVLVGGLGDRLDRLMPAGEAPQDLRLAPAGVVGFALGGVLGRKPVRAPTPDGNEPEPGTHAPRLGQPPGLDREG